MLSRVAESLYWLGRYHERAENTARLIQVNANLILDLPKGLVPDWEPLITILGRTELYNERHPEITERRIINFLISDEQNPDSILSCLSLLRENARTIREILPREGWEVINTLYNEASENKAQSYARHSRLAYLEKITRGLQLLTGLLAGSMTHDIGYVFLNLGRKLERADMTTRIIDVRAENTIPSDAPELRPFEDILWMSMLKSLSGYQMYRQTMQQRIRRNDVLKFLFCGHKFPRAVRFCVENMNYYLSELPNSEACVKLLNKLNKTLGNAVEKCKDNDSLHEYIDDVQVQLANVHDRISKNYFPEIV